MLCAAPSLAAGPPDSRLVEAAARADVAQVRALIRQGADVNAPYGDGATALHWAAHRDDRELADLLIRAGAAVDASNDLGATPLWLAGQNGSAALAERLLTAGANPNVALASGETPLMAAARSGNARLVELLIAAGADVNASEKRQGQTALMWAASQKHPSVARLLVAAGADVRARTKEWMEYVQFAGGATLGVLGGEIELPQHRNGGYTPLMFAARSGGVETARVLLAAGADIDEPTGSGTTPLVVAAHSGFGELGAFLLDRGADPNLAAGGYTALHAAILRRDPALVKALLAHGADPNARIERATPVGRSSGDYALTLSLIGATPFRQASSYNDVDIMRALLAGGADPGSTTPDGATALAAALEPTGRGDRRRAGADERTLLETVELIVDQAAHPAAAASPPVRPVLEKYCHGCHNQRLRTAGLTLDTADPERVGADAEVWEKVVRKLRAGTMPPAGRPRPDQATVDAVIARLETELDEFAAAHPNPGRFAGVRRLNRFEYQAAVSDLLGLEIDLSDLLPMDNTSDEGFDNYVSQLSVSPVLVERYLTAARRISAAAVGAVPEGPTVERHNVHLNLIQDARMSEDLPFGSQGGVAVRHHFPADGEYRIGIRLQRNYNDYIRGMGRPHDLDVRVNGVLVERFTIGGEDHGTPAPSGYGGNIQMGTEWEHYIHHADDNLEVTFAARAGPQVIGLSFVRDWIEPERIPQPRPWGFALATNEFPFGHMSVSRFDITGPLHPGGRAATPSRARLFVCEPQRGEDEESCARTILSTLARRAYRRPIGEADIEPLLAAYAAARRAGNFDRGIQNAVRTLLADPRFLLRIERAPTSAAPGGLEPVTDLELASRLSFFLWSSVPDDELLNLGIRGTLSRPGVLERQVRRLLADRRSTRSLVDSFAAQWLQLRMLEDVFRDPEVFPEFDENLRNGFEQETRRFVEHTLREDASVLELLRADYTFLNERLARHYAVPNVYGERFRRVELPPDSPRGGLLGHGSILTVTSYANRTSPVIRGKWLMQTILGMGPPPPPANVPALPESGGGSVPVSVRARLEQHRENPVCATCHAPMDPLGFALENFDGIGMWRATEAGAEIDSSAVMPDGTRFEGLPGLRHVLSRQPERFATAVVERLLAFSLGRALEHYDRPAVRKIVRDSAPGGYRWSSLVLGVVNSTPFRMKASEQEVAR